jgi:hypothetical protein
MKKYFLLLLITFLCTQAIANKELTALSGYRAFGSSGIQPSVVSNEYDAVVDSTNDGGFITAWLDPRGGGADVYVQKYSSIGTALWTANGVVIADVASNYRLQAIHDGEGGAIITWTDSRTDSGDIYAQKINAAGTPQWTIDGVLIATASGQQDNPMLISDQNGGAIITWQDPRSGTSDIYAQRISSSGTVQWAANGVVISSATGSQDNPKIEVDGFGGATIAWNDNRSGNYDIYVQRINSTGTVQWTANGVQIVNSTGNQRYPAIVHDSSFNTILAWEDQRAGNFDVYIQKVNSSGAVQWTANGVAVESLSNNGYSVSASIDNLNNTYLSWDDERGTNIGIFAQKINSSGAVQWTANGIRMSTDNADINSVSKIKTNPITSQSIITWISINSVTSEDRLAAKLINDAGTPLWGNNGVNISDYSPTFDVGGQYSVTATGSNELVVAFLDLNTTNTTIQKITNVNRINVTKFTDQMERINESTNSGHVIKYVSERGINPGSGITLDMSDFNFGASFDYNEISLAQGNTNNCETATFTNKTMGASPSGSTWGALEGSGFIDIDSDTDYIPPDRCIRITLTSAGGTDTITNPTITLDTVYNIMIDSGNESGQAAVIILNDSGTPDSDMIQINASIAAATLSLDLDTVNTGCNNNTETGLNTVALGILQPGVVKKSDTSINFICIDLASSFAGGTDLFAISSRSNAVGGLVSGGNSIPSATANLNSAGSGYGIRVSSTGTPTLGTFTAVSPFNSGTAGDVGALPGALGTQARFIDSSAAVQTGASSRIAVEVAAKASTSIPSGIYTDIVSIRAIVNF